MAFQTMPTYLIQRSLPGAGQLDANALKEFASRSNAVVRGLGPDYAWIHSYLTDSGITCVHEAPSQAAVRRHPQLGEFPSDGVTEIRGLLDPSTGTI